MPSSTRRADGRLVKKIRINGKEKYFYGKTEREINKKILEYKYKLEKPATFKEAAEAWNNSHRDEVGDKTWRSYQSLLSRAITAFGETPLEEIKPAKIQLFINKLNLAKKTVKTALYVVSMVFDYAILNDLAQNNPARLVKIPQDLPKKERELPSDEEIQKVISGVKCHFGEFAFLLLYTGMRRGEALALHRDNIDIEKRVIHITKAVEYESNRAHLKSPKTKAGNRDIFLVDALIPILKDKKGFIFGNSKPLDEHTFRKEWDTYCSESGVTITPHQLRHAHATLLYKIGIDVKSAQQLLGHSSYQVTMDIYTHISEQMRQNDFDKINRGLSDNL